MLSVKWIKSTNGDWLHMETFAGIEGVNTTGVYVIWHSGQNPRVVYVGQGDIKDRISFHRGNQAILAYRTSGTLIVTWAEVPRSYLDGVERYLADQLKPLVGDKHPIVVPIAVNYPWAA